MANMEQLLITLVLLSTLAIGIVSNDIKGPFDVCERDTFNATCSQGEIVLMESAMYGRMSLGTCIQQHVSSRNCDVDVLSIMDGFCSGLSTCSIRAIHPAFFDIKKCPEHAAYLSVTYKCLKANAENKFCREGQRIESANGYLASSQRAPNGAGTNYCPWTIISQDNTPINFTLYKFVPFQNSPLSSSSSVCFEIGTITEGGLSQGLLSCGSDARTKPIYLSKGVEVKVHFKDESFLSDLGNFVIRFNVIGCGEPVLPSRSSFTRSGSTATIICDDQSASWDIRCEKGQWVGEVGQCSSKEGDKGLLLWIKSNTSYSTALLGIVTLCCAVVIFFGGFCIYVSYFYIARRNPQPSPDANYTHTMDIYKLQTLQRLKRPPSAVYERTTSLQTPPGTMRRNTDYQRMNPIDPDTVSHHSYVLYDHVPKPLPPIPMPAIPIQSENNHIYETPHMPGQQQ